MVEEVDPLEVLENRKSNTNELNHDQSTETLRSADTTGTAFTKLSTNDDQQSTMDAALDKQQSSTTPAISLEFQPPMSSIVKAIAPPVTIIPAKIAGHHASKDLNIVKQQQSEKAANQEKLKLEQQQQQQAAQTTSTMKSLATTIATAKAVTGISNSSSNGGATTTGDRDTVDTPNVPLMTSSQQLVANLHKTAPPVNTPQASSAAILAAAKKVAFTPPNNQSKPPVSQSVQPRPATLPTGLTKPPPAAVSTTVPTLKPPPPVTSSSLYELPRPPSNPIDDALSKARLPLVGPYGSFVHPTDTSLADARKRLRIALDQTRSLRSAFSERVYQKYRVILKPVPDHVDKIVDRIRADPIGMNKKIAEEMRLVKDEKEVERKDAQKLAGAGIYSGSGSDGKHPSSAALVNNTSETADQLAYVGAGLNLVILPEEDAQQAGIDVVKYKYRGPTNPETGQRVGGISAAAATAAEVLLDRVRRATFLRNQRVRLEQTGQKTGISSISVINDLPPPLPPPVIPAVPATTTAASSSSILSRYQMLTSAVATPAVKLVGRTTPPYVPPVKPAKKAAKASASSSASSNKSRSRSQPVVPVGSILSLNPLVEDINPDRRPSASTSALLARGVGSKHQPQQWKHPHPDSLGGRKSSMSTNSKRGDYRGSATDVRIGLDLPPLPTTNDRREKRPLPVHDRTQVTSSRARDALQSILSQFGPREDATNATNGVGQPEKGGADPMQIDGEIMPPSRKRRATEIGLMRGMHHANEAGKTSTNVATVTAEVPGVHSTVPPLLRAAPTEQNAVEPIVAFSVLQALGLIHDTPSSQREQSPPVVQRLIELSPAAEASPRRLASLKFLALYRKVTAKKRSFTEEFAADFSTLASAPELQSEPKMATEAATNPESSAVPTSTGESSSKATVENGNPSTSVESVDSKKNPSEECAVVSIRGGGVEEDAAAAFAAQQAANSLPHGQAMNVNDYFMEQNERMRRPMSAPSSRPGSSSSAPVGFSQNRSSSSDGLFSVMAQNGARASFSPQRNAGFGMTGGVAAHRGVADRLQAQAHQLQQLQAAAMNRMPPTGDLSDLFGAGLHQRQGFAGHQDWGGMGASSQAAMNLVPSHASLGALGMNINPHQAAMLELSARDRATRALLMREQQAAVHAAAVHRHASAAAMRGGAGLAGLSSQQAAVLMNAQANQQAQAGMFSTAAASRFGQIGAHSAATAAAILSSPAAAALMGQSQLGVGSMAGQHSESRPSSQHSTSSTKSNKAKRPPSRPSSSKGRKAPKEEVAIPLAGAAEEPKDKVSMKRKAAEMAQSVDKKETEHSTAKGPVPALAAPGENRPLPASRDRSPPRKKLAPAEIVKVEKADEVVVQSEASVPAPSVAPAKAIPDAMEVDAQIDKPSSGSDAKNSPQLPSTPGMQFFVPPVPPVLDPQMATCVLDGCIHVAIGKLFLSSGDLRSVTNAAALLDYLQAVGAAVPIPKALVSNPLKERLNLHSFKISGNGGHMPSIPRDIVVGIILVWLWVQHKDSFQRAFAKSGRIDVDPECKWLIQAAVDAGSRALMTELSDAMQNGGPLASAISSARNKGGSGSAKASGSDLEKQATASVIVDTRVALIVSEALMTELCIDEEVDAVIPVYDDLVQLLDEARTNALKAKCRERVLLAAIVSQRATMSESFAHAYVSSMVRAGEALGHGDLFELVQDEATSTSTMIPYDIFSDESGAWEDPCRPIAGYTSNLTGEDLVRRAHARGMILKSLKKMQDRNNIKGGTPDSGPYTERSQSHSAGAGEKASHRGSSGSRRKSSFSVSDGHVQAGTGSGRATSINQYNPQHISTPLFWDGTSIENLPYGKHPYLSRPRALSISSQSIGKNDVKDGRKKARGRGSTNVPSQPVVEEKPLDGRMRRSTEAVDWADVAKVFQSVNLAGGTGRKRSKSIALPAHAPPPNPPGKTIFAPFCNRIDDSQIKGGESEAEEEDEDLSDEAILARHDIVLAQMKEKLDKFMEGRTTAGQRARQRAQARAAEKSTVGES